MMIRMNVEKLGKILSKVDCCPNPARLAFLSVVFLTLFVIVVVVILMLGMDGQVFSAWAVECSCRRNPTQLASTRVLLFMPTISSPLLLSSLPSSSSYISSIKSHRSGISKDFRKIWGAMRERFLLLLLTAGCATSQQQQVGNFQSQLGKIGVWKDLGWRCKVRWCTYLMMVRWHWWMFIVWSAFHFVSWPSGCYPRYW